MFTFLVRIRSCSRTHRRRHGFGVLHLEHPHYVLGVLVLVHKCSFLQLLDLEAEEELQLTIMLILNSLLMSSANLATKE
jgi:hypothetical protein